MPHTCLREGSVTYCSPLPVSLLREALRKLPDSLPLRLLHCKVLLSTLPWIELRVINLSLSHESTSALLCPRRFAFRCCCHVPHSGPLLSNSITSSAAYSHTAPLTHTCHSATGSLRQPSVTPFLCSLVAFVFQHRHSVPPPGPSPPAALSRTHFPSLCVSHGETERAQGSNPSICLTPPALFLFFSLPARRHPD